MKSRAELKEELALAEKKRMDVTDKNLSLGRSLRWAQECAQELVECAQELVDALVWSAEYASLPAAEGWSWYDALKKHAPSALEVFCPRDEETTEADVPTSTEATMTTEAVKEAVISIMSRETGTMNLRAEFQLAHEWVTEKDDFQDRLSALAMADGNRAKAKVIYSLRRGEV